MSILAILAGPAPAPASAAAGDVVSWALSSLQWVVQQFHNKNYMPAIGMVIMLLVFAFNKFAAGKISSDKLPLISAAAGVLAAVGTNLVGLAMGYGHADWVGAIASGLTAGAAASGFWSLLGKDLMAKLTPAKAVPAPAPGPDAKK